MGLESSTHSLVDKSLSCLATFLQILDFSTIKNDLFPIVAAVFTKTSSLAIKIRGLEALNILCGGSPGRDLAGTKVPDSAILDKYTVQEKVVPLLRGIKTKEPAVMVAALAVFKQVGKIADSDFLAIDVLPILWSFSLGPLLNLQQFQEFMDLIRTISSKIEQEQTRKLRDLTSNSIDGYNSPRSNDLMSMPSTDPFGASNVGVDDFERLVLGNGIANASDIISGSTRPQAQRAHTAQSISPTWPSSPPSSMASIFRPQQVPSSRAITPDQTLSSFAALQPSPNFISGRGVEVSSGWASIQPLQPISNITSNPWQNPPSISASIPNAWAGPPSTGISTAWGNPPVLQGDMRPVPQSSSFSIMPPPSTARTDKKTGLETYDSLI